MDAKPNTQTAGGCYAVADIADLHSNHTTGLNMPVCKLDDGQWLAPREVRWLWNKWLSFWSDFGEIAKSYGATPIGFFKGDTVDLDVKKYGDQMVTRNIAMAKENTIGALQPATDQLDWALFVRGTEAHVGKQAQHEENLAGDLSITVRNPDTGRATWWEWIGLIGDVKFDVQHHASMGTKPWTEKNAANSLAVELEYYYLKRRERLPDIALRGHNHRMVDSGDNFDVRVIMGPGWQLKNAHSYRRGQNRLSDIGGYIIVVQGSDYEVLKRKYDPAKGVRKVWQIEKLTK